MSVTSYVSSLIKHFTNREKVTNHDALEIRWSEQWFGILPFLWRWIFTGKKN